MLFGVTNVAFRIDIINDSSKFEKMDFVASEFITGREELYFQYFSHSLMALLKIGRHHSHMRSMIKDAVNKAFSRKNLELVITLKAAPNVKYCMKNKMKEIAEHEITLF